MQTVKTWAESQRFDYCFIDDELFSYVPTWYREKVANNILLISDLARLMLAKKLFSEGYERTIWVDADIVVFNPEKFTIDTTQEYAFCRELWTMLRQDGAMQASPRVNNAVTVFINPNHFLDFYIHACETIVSQTSQPTGLTVGTAFLTELYKIIPFTLINEVSALSPILMRFIANNNEPAIRAYMQSYGFPCYAANLCSSFRNTLAFGSIFMNDELYENVISKLLERRSITEPE